MIARLRFLGHILMIARLRFLGHVAGDLVSLMLPGDGWNSSEDALTQAVAIPGQPYAR